MFFKNRLERAHAMSVSFIFDCFLPFYLISRLCGCLWRSRDNDRRMKLAEPLLHQLLKLAFPPLLQMVGKMFIAVTCPFPVSISDRQVIVCNRSLFKQHIILSVSESDDALLKMSVPNTESSTPALPDFSRMTEDEQIAYALQMSMQGPGAG